MNHRDILLGYVDQLFQSGVLRFQCRRRGKDAGNRVPLIDTGKDLHHTLQIKKFDVFARRQTRLLEQDPGGEIGGCARHRHSQHLALQVGERADFRFRINRHDCSIHNAGDIDDRFAVQSCFDDLAAGIDDLEIFADERLSCRGRRNISDVNVQAVLGEQVFVRCDPQRRKGAAKGGIIRP